MSSNTPTLIGFEIHLELANELMKDQLERSKGPLIKYLREKLNNFKVDLVIDVNEAETKKYAYTPLEKFQKLREKNPSMDLLKKTFDLDL